MKVQLGLATALGVAMLAAIPAAPLAGPVVTRVQSSAVSCPTWKAEYAAYSCEVAFYRRANNERNVAQLLTFNDGLRQKGRQSCGASVNFVWSEASSDGDNAAHAVWKAIPAGSTYNFSQIADRCRREVARAQSAR